MLSPRYLEGVPDAMVTLYEQAEADALADMARRINTYDYWIPAAEHQRRALQEMGANHDYIMRRLTSLTGKSRGELDRLFRESGHAAINEDAAIYKAAGKTPPALEASKELQGVLSAGLKKTNGMFRNLTKTTAHTASKQFEDALDRAYMQITTGAFDRTTAVRNAIKDLARQGVGAVRYPSGHTDTIEVAVRRAVVTGVNQTALQLQWALADEMDCDLVETTAHGGARPDHAKWQGQVFSRSGKHPKYPDFRQATGYGTGAGLGGWNCRHSYYPYYEGMPRAYSPDQLAAYDAKRYTYNGRHLTEYEATQVQRQIERNIRRWKREQVAMQAAGQDPAEAASKVAAWQSRQRDFIRQTGLKRQSSREQIGKIVTASENPNANPKNFKNPSKRGIIKEKASMVDAIRKQEWCRTIRDEDMQALTKIFEDATEGEQRFWAKYGALVQGDFYDWGAGGYYSPRDKRVHLCLNKIDERSQRIGQKTDCRLFFHETGHLFDYQAIPGGRITSELDQLQDRLQADAAAYASALFERAGLRKVKSLSRLSEAQKQVLRRDLCEDPHLKNAVSDLFGGITDGRVSGMYGHSQKYFKRPGMLEAEAVAHLFDAKMMKGERKEVFTKYFPTTFAYFEDFMKNLEV